MSKLVVQHVHRLHTCFVLIYYCLVGSFSCLHEDNTHKGRYLVNFQGHLQCVNLLLVILIEQTFSW